MHRQKFFVFPELHWSLNALIKKKFYNQVVNEISENASSRKLENQNTVPLRCGWLEKNMTAMLTKYQFSCFAQGSKWALNENFSASLFWEILILEYLLYKGKLILRGNLKVFWPWITYLSKIFKKDYWWTTQILIWDQLK